MTLKPLAPPTTQRRGSPRRLSCALALLLTTSGLLLQGCAVTTDLTANQANTQSSAAASPWWGEFNDPLLAQLIQQAMQANPTILSSQAALRQARALRDVKLAATRPNLTVSGSVQRSTADNTPASINFSTGLDASWELDVFGANQSALANSEADLAVAKANLRDVQLSMTAEVALAYIQLRGLQAQIGIAEHNLSS